MNRKIRVAFIYNKDWDRLSGRHDRATSEYNFFMHAIKRNSRLDVKYFPTEEEIDVSKLTETDAILIPDDFHIGSPKNLLSIQKSSIPVICKVGDPHNLKIYNDDRIDYNERYKINCYFGIYTPQYFYEFYPNDRSYRQVLYGLEKELYPLVLNFKQRIKDKILLTGVVPTRNVVKLIYKRFVKSGTSIHKYYKLRAKCKRLSYVNYEFNMNYTELLSRYRSVIAATTVFPTAKYLENPAAGCLTFMEITKRNNGEILGFKDGENAVFIDEKNYKKKFQEYLQDVDNPKWEEIAMAGREYVMNNLTNDHAADKLADLMEEYIK